MPYRLELPGAGADALDRLVEFGALDIDVVPGRGVAALMPDAVAPDQVATALGIDGFTASGATARDEGSVWILRPRPVRVGRLDILPADADPRAGAIRLVDSAAFGTGFHPTTALCLEALQDILQIGPVDAALDVGTGSGVLALGALAMGVPRALGIDVDGDAVRVAAENAKLNGLEQRLELAIGGPETVTGAWPLVLANVVAGVLIDIAPALAKRVGHHGDLVLSGIAAALESEVERVYLRLGFRPARVTSRAGWVALVMQASW